MTYVSRRAPRAKQAEALDLIRDQRVFALLMSMRCGKSKVIVDDWGRMVDAGTCQDLLIIAPGGAYRPWPDAVLADLPVNMAATTKILLWDSSRAKNKIAARERDAFMEHAGPRVLVVNVEALSTVKTAQDLCTAFLRQHLNRNMGVIDESVRVKEVDTACSKFVVDRIAPLAEYRRIMTGLVSPRSPLDLYNQFRFLDWKILGHVDYATFKARYARIKQVCMLPNVRLYGMLKSRLGLGGYLTRSELRLRVKVLAPDLDVNSMGDAEMRNFLEMAADEGVDRNAAVLAIKALGGYVQTIPVVEGYENVEELRDKIAPYSFRCQLSDCYDLPPSDYSFWDVEMHPDQKRVYEELRTNATAELSAMDYVTATHVVVRMLRLHQVLCGHAVNEQREVRAVPELRTKALIDMLQDYDGKAVIWCSYDYSVRFVTIALETAFGEGCVARFWGGNEKTREQEEAEFKAGARRFMVATPDAGKYGRDWSIADLCVYYSCRNDLDHRSQSEERLKAVGKTRQVSYVDLRALGTVDEKIIRCLRDKIDMAAIISGDDWREWLV